MTARTTKGNPMRLMLDAAYLPAVIPHCDVLFGYTTGGGAAHIWTPEDWSRAKAAASGFVCATVPPVGADAIAGAALGRESVQDARYLAVPDGCMTVLDLEHADAAALVESGCAAAWVGVVATEGLYPVVYASEADRAIVERLGPLMLAQWNGVPELLPGTVATQYLGEQPDGFDHSVLADSVNVAPSRPGETGTGGGPVGQVIGTYLLAPGLGYCQVTSDGRLYVWKDGSVVEPEVKLPAGHGPIVAADFTPDGGGYLMQDANGGVYCFGNVDFEGALVDGQVKFPAS
jgi:hypothetical protein